jgi:hypothetical protein
MCGIDIQATYVWESEYTVMCIAVRNHVVCVKLYFWISIRRQAERKVEIFAFIYLIVVPGKMFIQENILENRNASLWKK